MRTKNDSVIPHDFTSKDKHSFKERKRNFHIYKKLTKTVVICENNGFILITRTAILSNPFSDPYTKENPHRLSIELPAGVLCSVKSF